MKAVRRVRRYLPLAAGYSEQMTHLIFSQGRVVQVVCPVQ